MMAARALQLAGLALALAGARAADCHIDSPMAAPANGNYGGLCATKLDFGVGEGCTLSCRVGFAVSGDGPVCVDVNMWENLGTQPAWGTPIAGGTATPAAQAALACPQERVYVARFFDTPAPAMIIEGGPRTLLLWQTKAASGTRYEGANILYWEHHGDARFVSGVGAESQTCRVTTINNG